MVLSHQQAKLKLGSRAGVDGVGNPLVGRTAARRVELDAEVLVRAARVVAEEKKKARMITTYTGGPLQCCSYNDSSLKGLVRDETRGADWSIGSIL